MSQDVEQRKESFARKLWAVGTPRQRTIARLCEEYGMKWADAEAFLGDHEMRFGPRIKSNRSLIVLFGVGATPVRAKAVEAAINGETPSEKLFEQVAVKVVEDIEDPMSDMHASADYRKHLAQILTRRGLAEAVTRAGGGA